MTRGLQSLRVTLAKIKCDETREIRRDGRMFTAGWHHGYILGHADTGIMLVPAVHYFLTSFQLFASGTLSCHPSPEMKGNGH